MSDAAFCERIVVRHARTFALASRLLPREKRRGAYAVYAFCRTADDIVDVACGATDRTDARDRLKSYRVALNRACAQDSEDPVLRELAWAVGRFGVPPQALQTLLSGVARDLDDTNYRTWAHLQRYCQEVASSVGEMCAAVFGVVGGPAELERAMAHARTLGLAMQLTNILRDVGEDARRGRCYLPDEDLGAFGLERDEVLSGSAAGRGAGWRRLMSFEIARARQLYREAIPGISLLSRDAQRCAIACASGYAGILSAIERNAYDTFTRRAVVGRVDRTVIFARAWLGVAPALPPARNSGNGTEHPSPAAA